jgi:hypothetical protein
MNIKTGGQAFPCGDFHIQDCQGVTIRDYFAGKALIGLMAKWNVDKTFDFGDYESASQMSYKFADAMLKAREV